ncbi:unnamed protein product [Amoebophrya sp. A120]|nr:unnamed protein product [Amoebophrya sp. A120]|eukprot:GSA120T00000672001.1
MGGKARTTSNTPRIVVLAASAVVASVTSGLVRSCYAAGTGGVGDRDPWRIREPRAPPREDLLSMPKKKVLKRARKEANIRDLGEDTSTSSEDEEEDQPPTKQPRAEIIAITGTGFGHDHEDDTSTQRQERSPLDEMLVSAHEGSGGTGGSPDFRPEGGDQVDQGTPEALINLNGAPVASLFPGRTSADHTSTSSMSAHTGTPLPDALLAAVPDNLKKFLDPAESAALARATSHRDDARPVEVQPPPAPSSDSPSRSRENRGEQTQKPMSEAFNTASQQRPQSTIVPLCGHCAEDSKAHGQERHAGRPPVDDAALNVSNSVGQEPSDADKAKTWFLHSVAPTLEKVKSFLNQQQLRLLGLTRDGEISASGRTPVAPFDWDETMDFRVTELLGADPHEHQTANPENARGGSTAVVRKLLHTRLLDSLRALFFADNNLPDGAQVSDVNQQAEMSSIEAQFSPSRTSCKTGANIPPASLVLINRLEAFAQNFLEYLFRQEHEQLLQVQDREFLDKMFPSWRTQLHQQQALFTEADFEKSSAVSVYIRKFLDYNKQGIQMRAAHRVVPPGGSPLLTSSNGAGVVGSTSTDEIGILFTGYMSEDAHSSLLRVSDWERWQVLAKITISVPESADHTGIATGAKIRLELPGMLAFSPPSSEPLEVKMNHAQHKKELSGRSERGPLILDLNGLTLPPPNMISARPDDGTFEDPLDAAFEDPIGFFRKDQAFRAWVLQDVPLSKQADLFAHYQSALQREAAVRGLREEKKETKRLNMQRRKTSRPKSQLIKRQQHRESGNTAMKSPTLQRMTRVKKRAGTLKDKK